MFRERQVIRIRVRVLLTCALLILTCGIFSHCCVNFDTAFYHTMMLRSAGVSSHTAKEDFTGSFYALVLTNGVHTVSNQASPNIKSTKSRAVF